MIDIFNVNFMDGCTNLVTLASFVINRRLQGVFFFFIEKFDNTREDLLIIGRNTIGGGIIILFDKVI